MTFPIYIELFGWKIHPHPILESLGMFLGFRLYLRTRRKQMIQESQALFVFLGAISGAFFGAIVLAALEHWQHVLQNFPKEGWYSLIQGKTIVGGLLGGLVGVEIMKKIIGYSKSTGDDMAIPLALGIAIGRIGCFLTGLKDETTGTATKLWTGMDFGDGVLRHPTQLYEFIYLLIIMFILYMLRTRKPWEGFLFQLFMVLYLCFRWSIEWLKPTDKLYIMQSAIQWACVLGVLYYTVLLYRNVKKRRGEEKHAKQTIHVL